MHKRQKNNISEIFNSINESGKVPSGWKLSPGGKRKVKINNLELINFPRTRSPRYFKRLTPTSKCNRQT